MSRPLGRFIRIINEECPECHSPILELRGEKVIQVVRGENIESEDEYKICPECGAEFEIRFRDVKKRIIRTDKTAMPVKPLEEKKERHNANNTKRYGTNSDTRKNNTRNFRKNN